MSTEQTNQIASRTYRACEGSRERYWETRKATGVVLNNGSFLQTYPERRHFYSLTTWKNHWSPLLSDPHFVGEEEHQYELRKKNYAAIPAFEPKLAHIRSELENYWRVIQQRPTVEPTAAPQARATVECFTCPACGLGSGADHRMCICRSYNYSVSAWEIACGLRDTPVAAPVAIPGEENFGSRTYRAYQNGRRVATVVVLEDGSICRVWPLPKRTFYSLNAWKKAMREEHGDVDIKGEEETIYRHYYAQHEDVIGNTYEVALRKTLEDYGRIIQQRPDEEPPVKQEPVVVPITVVVAEPALVAPVTATEPESAIHNTRMEVTAEALMNEILDAKGAEAKCAAAVRLYRFILSDMMPHLNEARWKGFRLTAIKKAYEFKENPKCSAELMSVLDEFLFLSIPPPSPHVPALKHQVAYVVTAVFGNDRDGMTVQQKTCSSMTAAGEILRKYYRAYCLMIDEPDEHFLDKKLTVEHLRKCLNDPSECNVAFFDSLSLSIRETRIWL